MRAAVLRRRGATANGQLARTPALAWLAAGVAAFAASVLVYQQLVSANPILWGHTDEWIYRAAGVIVHRHPADLYRVLLGEPNAAKLPFTYPPFAALVFALGTPFNFGVWQSALVVINVLLLPVILCASLRISGHRGLTGTALAFALAAMALWLEPVYMTMYFGQINLILLTLVIVDLALPDSCKWKGIGIGIAAGMKLTPLIFIPFLLGSRRIRAGLVALLSFTVTVVIGFLALPAASRDFSRGSFLEWFRAGELAASLGYQPEVAQANCSVSRRGVIRGIHFADVPPGQAKYVVCASGAILDVIVDVRTGSPSYGRWEAIRLDDAGRRAVFLSEGLGHAFMALSAEATVVYLCSTPYAPGREHGVDPFDPDIGIAWPAGAEPVLSGKDAAAPTLEQAKRDAMLPAYADCTAYRDRLRRTASGEHVAMGIQSQ